MTPRIADIQRAVCDSYRIPLASMIAPFPRGRRGVNVWDIAHPRQVAMALSVLLTEHSRTRIGYFFGGRDRSTVYHACAAVESRRRGDPQLHNRLKSLTLELVGYKSTTFSDQSLADCPRLQA